MMEDLTKNYARVEEKNQRTMAELRKANYELTYQKRIIFKVGERRRDIKKKFFFFFDFFLTFFFLFFHRSTWICVIVVLI